MYRPMPEECHNEPPMTCCIVGLLIFAAIGRVRRLTGVRRGETVNLFAPVAQRPAPGQTLAAVVAPEPIAEEEPADLLRYCALGIAVSLMIAPMLVWCGIVHNTGSPAQWLLRSICYLAVLAAAIALSRSTRIWRATGGAGTLLIVVGAVIFELGVVDMHVFGLFHIDHADVVIDMAFHGVGPMLAIIGGMLLLYRMGRTATSRRSSKSTVSSAHPESSAVTVGSTPPITT